MPDYRDGSFIDGSKKDTKQLSKYQRRRNRLDSRDSGDPSVGGSQAKKVAQSMLDAHKPSQFAGADVHLGTSAVEEEKKAFDETADKISQSGYLELREKFDLTSNNSALGPGNNSENNRSADFGFNKSQLSGLSGNPGSAGLTSQDLTLDVLMRVDLQNME